MNRRQFQAFALKASAAALLSRAEWAAATPSALRQDAPGKTASANSSSSSSSVSDLYRRAVVIDSLGGLFNTDSLPSAERLAAVRGSGVTAVHTTVSDFTFEGTVNGIAALEELIEKLPDAFLLVRKVSDIGRAKRENKIGVLPGFQYTTFLEDDPERIATFRKLGVRIMQLTYNLRGRFGDGCLERGNAGLSQAGVDAVKKMNEAGVAVDLSHSGYRTTSEGIAASAKPVLVSHAGCAAVYAHPRNKPDEILRALAERGGYFGVYLMPYLVASPTVPTREHVMAHLLHAIDVCGADHVGIGSDHAIEKVEMTAQQEALFKEDMARRQKLGIAAPGEDRYPYVPDVNGPGAMELIANEMAKRGQPSSVIEKVLGANFERVLGDIWGHD